MLSELILTLKNEGRWAQFVEAFKLMKQDIVNEFIDGTIKTEMDLTKAYAKMDVLDQIIGLENYVKRRGDQV